MAVVLSNGMAMSMDDLNGKPVDKIFVRAKLDNNEEVVVPLSALFFADIGRSGTPVFPAGTDLTSEYLHNVLNALKQNKAERVKNNSTYSAVEVQYKGKTQGLRRLVDADHFMHEAIVKSTDLEDPLTFGLKQKIMISASDEQIYTQNSKVYVKLEGDENFTLHDAKDVYIRTADGVSTSLVDVKDSKILTALKLQKTLDGCVMTVNGREINELDKTIYEQNGAPIDKESLSVSNGKIIKFGLGQGFGTVVDQSIVSRIHKQDSDNNRYVESHKYTVSADRLGDHIYVTDANGEERFVALTDLFEGDLDNVKQIDIAKFKTSVKKNASDNFTQYIGKQLLLRVGDSYQELQPLTAEQAFEVYSNNTAYFAPTLDDSAAMKPGVYRKTKTGQLVEEVKIQPICYDYAPDDSSNFEAYLFDVSVNSGTEPVIVDRSQFRNQSAINILLHGKTYQLNLNGLAKPRKLVHTTKGYNHCAVVQTTTTKNSNYNTAAIIRNENSEIQSQVNNEQQCEQVFQQFQNSFTNGRYDVKQVFNDQGESFELTDSSERFVVSDHLVTTDHAAKNAYYDNFQSATLNLVNDKFKGKATFNADRAQKKYSKAASKFALTSLQLMFTPVGLLTMVALPALPLVSLGALITIPFARVINNIRENNSANRISKALKNPLEIDRKMVDEDINTKVAKVFKDCVNEWQSREDMSIKADRKSMHTRVNFTKEDMNLFNLGLYDVEDLIDISYSRENMPTSLRVVNGAAQITMENAYLATRYQQMLADINNQIKQTQKQMKRAKGTDKQDLQARLLSLEAQREGMRQDFTLTAADLPENAEKKAQQTKFVNFARALAYCRCGVSLDDENGVFKFSPTDRDFMQKVSLNANGKIVFDLKQYATVDEFVTALSNNKKYPKEYAQIVTNLTTQASNLPRIAKTDINNVDLIARASAQQELAAEDILNQMVEQQLSANAEQQLDVNASQQLDGEVQQGELNADQPLTVTVDQQLDNNEDQQTNLNSIQTEEDVDQQENDNIQQFNPIIIQTETDQQTDIALDQQTSNSTNQADANSQQQGDVTESVETQNAEVLSVTPDVESDNTPVTNEADDEPVVAAEDSNAANVVTSQVDNDTNNKMLEQLIHRLGEVDSSLAEANNNINKQGDAVEQILANNKELNDQNMRTITNYLGTLNSQATTLTQQITDINKEAFGIDATAATSTDDILISTSQIVNRVKEFASSIENCSNNINNLQGLFNQRMTQEQMKQTTAKIDKLQKIIKNCQDQIGQAIQNIVMNIDAVKNRKDVDIEELKSQAETFKRNLQQAVEDLNTANAKLGVSDQKIAELEQQVSQLNSDLENVKTERDKLNNQITDLNSEIQTLNSDIAQATKTIQDNQNKIDSLQAEIEQKDSTIASQASDIQAKKQEIERLKVTVQEQIQTVNRLNKQLQQAEEQRKALQSKVETLSAKNEQLLKENGQLTDANTALKDANTKLDALNKKQQGDIDNLNAEIENKETQIRFHVAEISRQRVQLQEDQEIIKNKDKLIEHKESVIQAKNLEIAKKKKMIAEQMAAMKKLRGEVEGLKQEREEMLQKHEVEKKTLQDEIDGLNAELANKDNLINKLVERSRELEEKLEAANRKAEQLTEQRLNLLNTVASLIETIDNLLNGVMDASDYETWRTNVLSGECRGVKTKVKESISRLNSMSFEIDEKLRDIDVRTESLNTLINNISGIDDEQLKQMCVQANAKIAALAERKPKLNAAKAKVAELSQKYSSLMGLTDIVNVKRDLQTCTHSPLFTMNRLQSTNNDHVVFLAKNAVVYKRAYDRLNEQSKILSAEKTDDYKNTVNEIQTIMERIREFIRVNCDAYNYCADEALKKKYQSKMAAYSSIAKDVQFKYGPTTANDANSGHDQDAENLDA